MNSQETMLDPQALAQLEEMFCCRKEPCPCFDMLVSANPENRWQCIEILSKLGDMPLPERCPYSLSKKTTPNR